MDPLILAGAGGFEPPYGGIKIHCLTTWRRPNGRKTKEVAGSFRIPVSRQRRSIDAVQLFQQGRSAKIPLNTAPANCPTARGAVAGRFRRKESLDRRPLSYCIVLPPIGELREASFRGKTVRLSAY